MILLLCISIYVLTPFRELIFVWQGEADTPPYLFWPSGTIVLCPGVLIFTRCVVKQNWLLILILFQSFLFSTAWISNYAFYMHTILDIPTTHHSDPSTWGNVFVNCIGWTHLFPPTYHQCHISLYYITIYPDTWFIGVCPLHPCRSCNWDDCLTP